MAVKRRGVPAADPPAAKRACRKEEEEEEFNGARFKALLRDPATAGKGLETFVSVAKTLPSPEIYDVVEGYVKISMECAEIFKLLDGERKPESEMLLIFQALEAILLRTASDLSHFSVVGMNIVKKLIHSYMRLVYAALYSENYRMSRVCLTLLSAMVAQGPDSARDVYSHFDFNNKFLPGLLKKRCKKGGTDVRMAYIQFALSFLIAGDNTILTQVLELKDFIPDILRSEIKEDKVSTVNLLLSTLRTKVVQNKNITKTQKVRFFTAEVLIHIASLYRWNGITDVSPGDLKVTQGSEEVGKMMVRELVHNFLMDLCCSLKHGITFYDPSLGTSGKGGNVVLLRFLLGLKTATEDEMVADLMVNILKVCPDLLNRYFKEAQYSFVPRLKSAWMDNMKLLRKIYEAQPEISNSFKTSEFIPLPRLLSMVMITTVPAVCNKIMFTQGLNLASTAVKHSILSLVSVVLRRALKNIEYCLNEEIWQKSEIYTLSMMQEFVQLYREAISKLLPDMNNIVAVWQSLLKQGREHHDGQEEKREGDTSTVKAMTETAEVAEQHGSDDAETLFLKAALLQVICLYQKVVPHLVTRSNFDFSKLLKGIVTEKGLREEVPPVLQYHILKVALELPANKFAWFRVQDVSETEKVSGEKSVFYLLMKMFVTSNHSHLKISTKKLIIKVLRDSGVFEYTWKELSVWLEHLDNTKEDRKEAVIQFLERILLKLVTNPYPYTDKAADLVQEASMLQVNVFKQDSDNVSIPISHIDDVLDMVDVLIEGSDGLDEEIGFTLNEDTIIQTFPFSAVVPAALEARNILLLQTENGTGAHIVKYLVGVFTDLLHSQRDPLALCLMFQLYDKDLQLLKVSKYPQLYQFNQYYNLWIPQQSQQPLFKKRKEVCKEPAVALDSIFSTLLKKAYERGSDTLLEDNIQTKLRDLASHLPPEQLLLGVKHVLLYLKSTVENFGSLSKASGPALVDLYVDLLSSLLCRGNQIELDNQQKREKHQTESDLFMDEESLIMEESSNDKTLEDTLMLIFRHPTLESWFLALEQRSLPQHSLNPVTVKLLSAHLNSGVLQLLKMGAPMLQSMDHKLVSAVTPVLRKALWKELCSVFQDTEVSRETTVKLQVLSKLLPSSESKGLRNLIDLLPAALEKAENNESWTVADAISRVLENSEELNSWRRRLLSACMKGLIVMYSSSKDERKQEVERSMLLRLEELLHFVEEVDPDDWYSLVKTGLKYRYTDEAFLKVLNIAIQLLYKKESSLSQRLVKLSKLHMMVTQHSLFLSAILRSREEDGTNTQTREALVDILLTVVKLSPSLCESSHLAVLLGAYGATLSAVDQKILLLLQFYEKNNQSLINSRILLWGPAAVEHHKTCKSLGKSLWQQPSMEEILCLLDREKMMRTILSFPQHRRLLSSQEVQESLYRDESVKSLDDFYDPRFLLQLFSELTRPECVVACHKFVEVNALGLTVAALSSYDSNMRAAAYFVLASFRSHLEGGRFPEKNQLLYLLDAVQNGIGQPNLRFTFSLSLYVARVAQQILKPEEHIYIKVNRFLLSHQYLDLRKVPGFFQLFYSFDFEYKTEREWILRFLGEGLRDKHCYELYDYQRIFQVILSFFNSPLCDEGSQNRILEILQNAAHVTRAAYELIQDHSLLTWILHILEKRFLENKLLNKIISLLHTLWLTNLGGKRESKNQSQENKNRKFLPIQLVNEFLYVLITLIKHIRTNFDPAKLTQFFSTLNSVLEYRAIVVEAFKEMSRFTVNDGILSNKEILLLLHKWSIIEKDLQLQEDVQTLAQKYQIKELLKNIKEKNKSQGSSHAYHHIRKKNEIEREGDAAADLEVSELEKCRHHLNSIFAHWEPVFPVPPTKHQGEPLKSADREDETVGLTCASTYVVTKWLVKSMVEHSLNVQSVSLTLRWLQHRILPHPVAVQEMLRDETLRNNIFKFYTRICEASSGTAGLLEELCLFSSVMLHLMDAQGLTNNSFHEPVKTLCLSAMTEEDANKKAVCVFLTSVYIGDIWLGAQEPDMLITHVKLICRSTDDKLNDEDLETHKQAEETIMPLCKTLYLATLGP
ncbi:nucleolar pre-ribosomal-associated protein 1 isoform X4 [Grus americana]|uniref:nucleolar pre-ribosomal-associated protein 1 isoform X4 n=1 Tax=Grus americana TaxID=9117 RepID=UPI0024078B5F|nr:nucleolar pre-ribosomal-associated protein 1 isoform X4 [Grus americana]